MAYYACGGQQSTVASTYKGCLATLGAASNPARHAWYEVDLGPTGSPNSSDTSYQWDISRLSNTTSLAGSSTNVPNPIDPADVASLFLMNYNQTTEPSAALITSSLFNHGANQRIPYRWAALQESQYFKAPATSAAGLYLRVLSATYASSFAAQVYVSGS